MVRDVKRIPRLDFEPDVAIGVGLPFGTNNNFNLNYETKEQIKDNLRNLILTIKGERVFNPRFGCDVYKLVFDPNTIDLRQSISTTIETAVEEFLPYITIEEIVVNDDNFNVDNNILKIVIAYSVPQFKFEDYLQLEIDRG